MKNEDQILIDKAIKQALNTKSTTGYSLFNPRKIRNNLKDINIHLSLETLAIFSFAAIDEDYDNDPAINSLCKELNNTFAFKERFIKQQITPINEYQLRAFCNEFHIHYPGYISWKPVMYKILRLHVTTMYRDAFNTYKSLKKESKIMPIEPVSHSNVASHTQQNQNHQVFNVVTTKVIHTVNDRPVDKMSKQELFNCSLTLKQSIKCLKDCGFKSTAVKAEVKQQKKILKQVIKYLDTK